MCVCVSQYERRARVPRIAAARGRLRQRSPLLIGGHSRTDDAQRVQAQVGARPSPLSPAPTLTQALGPGPAPADPSTEQVLPRGVIPDSYP